MMKTKNNLTTGVLIGIGLIVLPLILMGTISSTIDNEVGTYQGFSREKHIYMINTKTGETWCLSDQEPRRRSWKLKTRDNKTFE